MKLSEISNMCLSTMLEQFKQHNETIFVFDTLCELLPDLTEDEVDKGLRTLISDNLISCSLYADDFPYTMELKLSTIRDAQDNTALVKTYKILKEIRSWF